jgi:integrase/recombinase XerD
METLKNRFSLSFLATVATFAAMSNRSKYHDYDKDPFCITEYRDKNRPALKSMVRSKLFGKWERKFFGTEREAKTYVDLKRIELHNDGKEGAMFPAELRVMAHRADEQLKPFGKTISDAVDHFLKYLFAESRSVSIRQAVDELLANRRGAGLSKVYCGDLQFRLGRFAKAFGDRSVASITTREIIDWLELLRVGPVTRNTFRRDARTLFSFCCDHKYCVENPVASKATRAKEQSREVEVLSVEDARRLLAASSPEMLPYWTIGLFAGLRPSEIRKLQWSDVDLEDALITVRSTKTGRKRFVNMQPNLIAWLAPYRQRDGKVVAPVNFRRQSAQDKAAAGLSDWPTNCLRHTFGSNWLGKFNDINALALQMGNSPAVIEKHYKRAVKPKEAHRFWSIMPSTPADIGGKVVAMTAAS